jgi:hypothetical protein
MSYRLINIYCAMWIKQTTNKSCQNFPFFLKKQQNPVSFAINRRFRAVCHRFFTGKPVQIQIDLNWSNRSVFTGLPLVNCYRWGGAVFILERFCKPWWELYGNKDGTSTSLVPLAVQLWRCWLTDSRPCCLITGAYCTWALTGCHWLTLLHLCFWTGGHIYTYLSIPNWTLFSWDSHISAKLPIQTICLLNNTMTCSWPGIIV